MSSPGSTSPLPTAESARPARRIVGAVVYLIQFYRHMVLPLAATDLSVHSHL